jgi:hypothetical protein
MPYSTNEEEAALDSTNLFEEDFDDDSFVVEDDINIETIKERKKITKSEGLFQNSFKNEDWFYEKLTTSTDTKTSALTTALTETPSLTTSTASITLSNEKETNDILKVGTIKRNIKQKNLPKS